MFCSRLTDHTTDELIGDTHVVAALWARPLPLRRLGPAALVYLTVRQTRHGRQGARPAPAQPQQPGQRVGCPAPSATPISLMSESARPPGLVLDCAPLGWTLWNNAQ